MRQLAELVLALAEVKPLTEKKKAKAGARNQGVGHPRGHPPRHGRVVSTRTVPEQLREE
jgi:hypothetical protein